MNGRETPPRENWTRLPPGHLVRPTFWPAGLGLGITFLFWSIVTNWVVFAAGAVLSLASLAGWIRELLHEGRHS